MYIYQIISDIYIYVISIPNLCNKKLAGIAHGGTAQLSF